MNLSANFMLQEFVPKEIYARFGSNSRWFVNPKVAALAQFYKDYFLRYYSQRYGADRLSNVLIVINNWHQGGPYNFRGYRPRSCTEGGENSQHRLGNAFDCDMILVFADGTRQEVDYADIHQAILSDQDSFLLAGLSAIEHLSDAPSWLHSDCRWIENATSILVVRK